MSSSFCSFWFETFNSLILKLISAVNLSVVDLLLTIWVQQTFMLKKRFPRWESVIVCYQKTFKTIFHQPLFTEKFRKKYIFLYSTSLSDSTLYVTSKTICCINKLGDKNSSKNLAILAIFLASRIQMSKTKKSVEQKVRTFEDWK